MNRKEMIKAAIEKDGIDLSQKGFVRKHHGRLLVIYYISEEYIVYIDGEMSGASQYDFLICAEYRYLDYAFYPGGGTFRALSPAEKQRIQTGLIAWLAGEGIRHDIKVGE